MRRRNRTASASPGRTAGALSLARLDQRRPRTVRARSALAAVAAAARSEDGRGEKSSSSNSFRSTSGSRRRSSSLARSSRAAIPWLRLGELAPLVFEAAETDTVAAEIVDRQAGEVVASSGLRVQAARARGRKVEVVLGGGCSRPGNARLLHGIEAVCARSVRGSRRTSRSRARSSARCCSGSTGSSASPDAYERARRSSTARCESGRDVAGDAAAVAELP